MAARRISSGEAEPRRSRPATTPEGREQELIALATDLVEKRLREGTASSQETTHFLKMGSPRERLEREKLASEVRMNAAKEEMLASQQRIEETYAKALAAMRRYGGHDDPEEPQDGYQY